jgi:hypothetical protein
MPTVFSHQASNTHFKKFIQVTANYAQVLESLKQGNRGVFSLSQYALIEGEQR